MSDADDYRVVDTETIFTGRIITVRRDSVQMHEGTVSRREVVGHLGAVGVVALDDDGKVVLVNQYRHPVGARLDELPAGLLDVEGESALEAAKRELLEEASLVAADWHVLLDLHTSPGFSTEAIRLYLARDLSAAPDRDGFVPEHEERTMTVRREPLDDAVRRACLGEITNATAVAGLLAGLHGLTNGWRELRPADVPWPARPGR